MKKIFVLLISLLVFKTFADEIEGMTISGQEISDEVSKLEIDEDTPDSPYVYKNNLNNSEIDNLETKLKENPFVTDSVKEQNLTTDERSELRGFGVVEPGKLANTENYLEINPKEYSRKFIKASTSLIELNYFKDNFDYTSNNDVINRTVGDGYKHVKGGFLSIHRNSYIFKTMFLNGFWSSGLSVGYSSGKGIFVDGSRSDATMTLWQFPLDFGIGIEIPLYYWFKVSIAAGPSGMVLNQNRSDFSSDEKGKSKTQFGYGPYGLAAFKINLSGMFSSFAYDWFTSSQITNLLLNVEMRYHKYSKFLDPIDISGTSIGAGVTFEFL